MLIMIDQTFDKIKLYCPESKVEDISSSLFKLWIYHFANISKVLEAVGDAILAK